MQVDWKNQPVVWPLYSNSTALVNKCAYELCNIIYDLQLCSACEQAWYCSEDHQRRHWTKHQEVCNPVKNTTSLMTPSLNQQAFSVLELDVPPSSIYLGSAEGGDKFTRPTVSNINSGADNFTDMVYSNFSPSSQQLLEQYLVHPTASQNLARPAEKTLESHFPIRTTYDSSGDICWDGNSYHQSSSLDNMNKFASRRPPESSFVSKPSNVIKCSMYSSATPNSFLSPKNMRNVENRNPQSGLGMDPSSVVAQDTDQFSDKIRRSSSFPLNPIALLDGETGTASDAQRDIQEKNKLQTDFNSRESLFSRMKPAAARTFEGKSSVPAIGDLHLRTGSSLAIYVTHWMQKYGICVLDNFLSEEHGDNILQEMKSLYENGRFTAGQLVKRRGEEDGRFTAGQLVKGRGEAAASDIRGDLIAWADGTEPDCTSIGHLISTIDSVIIACQKNLTGCKISGRTKAMLACYPGNGTRYLKHVDNPSGDGRKITCIYYLNKNWNSREDGGLLRIYPAGQEIVANIEPLFNRLILFWSDRRNPHEVFPAYATRFAVTVWYFDLVERGKAKIKTKE